MRSPCFYHHALVCLFALVLNGCLLNDPVESPEITDTGPPTTANRPPTISGSPPTSVVAGQVFSFTPTASDPDGDTLTFAIQNQPFWSSFDSATGRVEGTASALDVGTTPQITISVSDGQKTASLDPFSIEIVQVALGAATLTWTPPTTNEDGSALTDLAGFKIYYGTSEWNFTQIIDIDNSGLSAYVVENLSPATYYFAMTAYDTGGSESVYSEMISKVISN